MHPDGGFIDTFIAWLRDMDGTTAYLAVLGVLGLCGLGLPMPEDIVLISAGFLASMGKFSLGAAIVAGMVGVLSGDAVLFFLGRRFGPEAFNLPFVRRIMSPEKVALAQQRVQENARFICFIARFLPGLRSPIYLTAGAMQIPPRTYLLQDGLAASISVPLWVFLGWYFGGEIERALLLARDLQLWLAGAVLVVVVVYVLRKRAIARRVREAGEG